MPRDAPVTRATFPSRSLASNGFMPGSSTVFVQKGTGFRNLRVGGIIISFPVPALHPAFAGRSSASDAPVPCVHEGAFHDCKLPKERGIWHRRVPAGPWAWERLPLPVRAVEL